MAMFLFLVMSLSGDVVDVVVVVADANALVAAYATDSYGVDVYFVCLWCCCCFYFLLVVMLMAMLMHQMLLLLVLMSIVSFLLMLMLMVVLLVLLLLLLLLMMFLISCADLSMFVAANWFSLLVVCLSSIDLSTEYFGRRFSQKPIAIFDISEPCDTRKALIEFLKEMRTLSVQGLYIHDPERGPWLYKSFLKEHLADALAR